MRVSFFFGDSQGHAQSLCSPAAVDMHTAQHLLEIYLCGALMIGRTVILSTRHLSLCLPRASYLVKLASVKVEWQGSLRDIRNNAQLEAIIKAEEIKPEDQFSPTQSPGVDVSATREPVHSSR